MTKEYKAADKTYDSNPFTLALNAFERLIHNNPFWAIAMIGFGVLQLLWQGLSLLANSLSAVVEGRAGGGRTLAAVTDRFASGADSTDVAGVLILILVILLIVIAISLVFFMLATYVTGMLTYVSLQSEQGRRVSFQEAVDAVNGRFWRLFKARLLAGLKIFAWSLLLIVPGIIASLRYSLLPYLIMSQSESEHNVRRSHSAVKQVVRGRLGEVLGVGTVAAIIPVVGWTIGIVGRGALYRQLAYHSEHNLEKPKVHWLNYIAFILIGAFMFFVVLLVVGVLLLAA